jgi:glycosyltransferase 2 family protein
MNERRKRLVLLTLGFLLSAGALLIFARVLRGEWPHVKNVLTRSPGTLLLGACGSVAAIALYYACRIARLCLLLRPVHPVSWHVAADATLIGFMANCVLPLRAGELIRPYVLHKEGNVRLAEAFGTAMGLERTLDLIGLCVLFLVTWLLLRSTMLDVALVEVSADRSMNLRDVWKYGRVMVLMAAIGLAGLMLLAFAPRPTLRLAEWMLRPLPRSIQQVLLGLAHGIAASTRILRLPLAALGAMALTLGQWAALVLSTYLLARGLNMRLSLEAVLLIQLVTTVFVALPQAPAFVGLFQCGALFGARLMEIDTGTAAALALCMWVINVVPVTLAGLTVLWRSGWSLGQLAREARSNSPEDAQAPAP